MNSSEPMPSVQSLCCRFKLPCCAVIAIVFGNGTALAEEINPLRFLKTHCVRCHGAEEQKSDRRFDALQIRVETQQDAWDWEDVLDAINRGDMPPEGESQPAGSEKLAMVSWITSQLASHANRTHETAPKLRRLNAAEYRNTIRDLLHIQMDSFNPTADFPPDEEIDGFRNNSNALILSDFLLEKYLAAATASVEKAIRFGEPPAKIKKVFLPNDMCDRKFHFRPQIWFVTNPDGEHVTIGHGDRESVRVCDTRFKGVPADGFYTIRIDATALGRINRYDSELLGIDPAEPLKAEIVVTNGSIGKPENRTNASDRTVARIPLADDDRKTYKVRVWMDKGFVPVIVFGNGPQPIKGILRRIGEKYHRESMTSNWWTGDTEPAEEKDQYFSDVYEGPRIRIFSMEIEGPEYEQWPIESHEAIFGPTPIEAEQIDPVQVVENFATQAFRRPLLPGERDRYVSAYRNWLRSGLDPEAAIKATLSTILTSPHFLYIQQPWDKVPSDSATVGFEAARQFSLASRLSYFLWSSMPDEELLSLAAKGELDEPEQLQRQLNRMLDDSRSKAFADQFTDSWLRLAKLGAMPPDEKKFRVFYRRRLKDLMKEETRHFFQYMLQENRPLDDFIDSDYTFANRYLADLYQIGPVQGEQLRKVSLPKGSLRGGLLGHASILTATSNGVETSPVVRGIWVLENLLGAPPAPPPPDVDPLEPDTRGATTIREQLQKHREIETCAECHRKIDPIGFALESFDPIGQERTLYEYGKGKPTQPVDTSGKLPSGPAFDDVIGLRKVLLNRRNQFVRCLTEKMLIYALGRELSFADRRTVDNIIQDLNERGGGLRDLVELIVASDAFRDSQGDTLAAMDQR